RWPPFDPTVDWQSTTVDRWLTGVPVVAGKPRSTTQVAVTRCCSSEVVSTRLGI
ncbi:hypothetical protein Tco_0521283, partial [Tanacetum coccineum]